MRKPAATTHWLSHARFEPTAHPPGRQRLRLLVAALLVVTLVALAGGGGSRLLTWAGHTGAQAENERLAAEVERLRTELAMEQATRRELERQAASLGAQVAELTQQVEFLKARRTATIRTN